MATTRKTKRGNAHDKLEQDLRQQIRSGIYGPDKAIPSEPSLARQYGISRETARNALKTLVDEGYLKKINGRGTFVIPPAERRLSPHRQRCFYLLIRGGNQGSYFYDTLISGMAKQAFLDENRVIVKDMNVVDKRELLADYNAAELDGIVWEQAEEDVYPTIQELDYEHIPQIAISRQIPGIPSLFFDIHSAILEILEFLFAIAHRNVAFMTTYHNKQIVGNWRRDFQCCYQKNGRTFQDEFFIDSQLSCQQLADTIRNNRISAVICHGGSTFDSLQQAVDSLEYEIPRDLSIMVIHDRPEYKDLPCPISVFTDSREQIGQKAAQMLNELCRGKQVPAISEPVSGELIMRKSCAAPSEMKH